MLEAGPSIPIKRGHRPGDKRGRGERDGPALRAQVPGGGVATGPRRPAARGRTVPGVGRHAGRQRPPSRRRDPLSLPFTALCALAQGRSFPHAAAQSGKAFPRCSQVTLAGHRPLGPLRVTQPGVMTSGRDDAARIPPVLHAARVTRPRAQLQMPVLTPQLRPRPRTRGPGPNRGLQPPPTASSSPHGGAAVTAATQGRWPCRAPGGLGRSPHRTAELRRGCPRAACAAGACAPGGGRLRGAQGGPERPGRSRSLVGSDSPAAPTTRPAHPPDGPAATLG